MKYIFAFVYVLVLATQLPHVWHSYAALERPGFALAHVTAIGAAIAFELATGVFTLRVVQGSRRRATRAGLAFFIIGSAVANAFYYGWLPLVFDRAMPVFATIALPLALALFAEEFGTEVEREQREAERERAKAERKQRAAERDIAEPAPLAAVDVAEVSALPFACDRCTNRYPTQQALAGHIGKAHRGGNGTSHEPLSALVIER